MIASITVFAWFESDTQNHVIKAHIRHHNEDHMDELLEMGEPLWRDEGRRLSFPIDGAFAIFLIRKMGENGIHHIGSYDHEVNQANWLNPMTARKFVFATNPHVRLTRNWCRTHFDSTRYTAIQLYSHTARFLGS